MLDELRVVGDHHVFTTIVRNTVKLGEAPLVGRPITAYATNSDAARVYRSLAQEVIELTPSGRSRRHAIGGDRSPCPPQPAREVIDLAPN